MFICAYTDGACSGNPGPGGWGVIITATKDKSIIKKIELNGGEEYTTNNRMELTAAINALNALERPSTITIYTDSVYVGDKGYKELGKDNDFDSEKYGASLHYRPGKASEIIGYYGHSNSSNIGVTNAVY